MRNPMQPIVVDAAGVVRFRENSLVRLLLNKATERGFGLNELAGYNAQMPEKYPDDDFSQLSQLIGYSLTGYHELDHVLDESALAASAEARKLLPDAKGCRDDGCPIHTKAWGVGDDDSDNQPEGDIE